MYRSIDRYRYVICNAYIYIYIYACMYTWEYKGQSLPNYLHFILFYTDIIIYHSLIYLITASKKFYQFQ